MTYFVSSEIKTLTLSINRYTDGHDIASHVYLLIPAELNSFPSAQLMTQHVCSSIRCLCELCWRDVKGAMLLPSGVRLWMKNGWGQATGWGHSFVLPSVLSYWWLGIRKSIQAVEDWVMRCCGCVSGARYKWFAYRPADATATPSSLAPAKSRSFLMPAYPGCPGKKAIKRMQ